MLIDVHCVGIDRVLARQDFEMVVSGFGASARHQHAFGELFQRGASNYMGLDDPKLEAMVRQWRRSMDPEARKHLSADMQRPLIAEQLYWVNVTGYPVFQAYRQPGEKFTPLTARRICSWSKCGWSSDETCSSRTKEVYMKLCRLMLLSLLAVCMLGTGSGWAQQPKPGGTLRIALPGDPAFYNAHQGPAMGAQAFWTSNNIYNSLLTTTPPPELKIVPDLAKSWEVLDEGRTYVFHLHEGVTFHDGTDFDAQAAKWNIDRIIDPEVKSWIRPYYEDIDAGRGGGQIYPAHPYEGALWRPAHCPRRLLPGYPDGVPQSL